jgi:hypothetical protein
MRRFTLALLVAAAMFSLHSSYAAEVVSQCDMAVTHGVLSTDLDCSSVQTGVTVLDGGDLDLAGHTLTAGASDGVRCQGRCQVDGNRAITNGETSSPEDRGSILGAVFYGIAAEDASVANVNIIGTGTGIAASKVELTNSSIDTLEVCIIASKRVSLEGSDLVAGLDYGRGIVTWKKVSLIRSTVTGGRYGIETEASVRLADESAVEVAGVFGIRARRLRADNSQIIMSGDPDFYGSDDCLTTPDECGDILTRKRPRLNETPCNISQQMQLGPGGVYWIATGEDWDVCTKD